MSNKLVLGCVFASSVLLSSKPPFNPIHQDLSFYFDASGQRQAIGSVGDWQKRRIQVLDNMQVVMGPLPNPDQPVPLQMEVLDSLAEPGYDRKKIRYHTDSTQRWVHAWLLVPHTFNAEKRPLPAVLCLHQTTKIGKDEPAGLGGNPNLHYARELALRGFVTLSPDYPSFGEYEYDFAQDDYISGTMKAIYDNIRAVDLLQSLPEVDRDRIGCIGHSLGGHNTMFTAAFEPRIKALVSNCGFTRFHKYYNGNLRGWTSDRYMPRIRTEYDNHPNLVPFDFPEIVGSFAPRPFLAVAPVDDGNFEVSGVKDCIAAAVPVYKLHGKPDHLRALYPDCAHDFPETARKTAYEFLEKHLAGD